MRRAWTPALSLLLLLAPLAFAPVRADDGETETKRLLGIVRRDADPDAWADAVKRLKDGSTSQREQLHTLLRRMAEERLRRMRKAHGKIVGLAAKVGDGGRDRKKVAAWEEARQSATDWIFDEKAFPVPVEVVITGPKEGYGIAKQRGDLAVKTWKVLSKRLDRALAPALTLSRKRAHALARERAVTAEAFRRVARELPDPPSEPAEDTLAELLLRTRLGDLEPVAEAYAGEAPGWRRLCLYYAWCRAVLDYNEEHDFMMRKDALEGVRYLNDYRIALGISPVVHHVKLVIMAHKHSEEMTKLGYFSHRSPIPERETKEKRAKIEGYDAQVVEGITGAGGGATAVEFWKYDGGHHRDMTNPEVVEVGFSTRGPAVYVGGKGATGGLPGLRY